MVFQIYNISYWKFPFKNAIRKIFADWTSAVKQGGVVIMLDYIMRSSDQQHLGLSGDLGYLDFADDICLLSAVVSPIWKASTVVDVAKSHGLKCNVAKSKVIRSFILSSGVAWTCAYGYVSGVACANGYLIRWFNPYSISVPKPESEQLL